MKRIFRLLFCFLLSIYILNAQHLKKNGTLDMRYKENKLNYSQPLPTSPSYSSPTFSEPANSGTHLKKDGTPDMRYKENKLNYSQPKNFEPDYKRKSYENYFLERDKNGKIKRSESAKYDFMKLSGFPNGRLGYVIDHIIPLKKGGCDCPSNMQWQTIADSKVKDKVE